MAALGHRRAAVDRTRNFATISANHGPAGRGVSRFSFLREPMRRITLHFGIALHSIRLLLLAIILVSLAAQAAVADRIILRNLKIIDGPKVVTFDEDGVRLDDDRVVGWYDIEKARVADDQQPRFDRMLKELGDPLFRIRQRMRVGDYKDLSPHAEAVYPRYMDRKSPTAYLVMQATMWSRVAMGQRESAVEPYCRCYQYLRLQSGSNGVLPGERRLKYDPKTGMCASLAPVWFDVAAAKAALPSVYQSISTISRPRPEGAYVYFTTLALAAGDTATADRVLGAIKSDSGPIHELRDIIAVQRELMTGKPGAAAAALDARLADISPQNQPLALYWLGRVQLASTDVDTKKSGLVRLLRIPALYGSQAPEISAAALSHGVDVLKQLDDVRGSVALRNELLVRYGQTYLAAQALAPSPVETPQETP